MVVVQRERAREQVSTTKKDKFLPTISKWKGKGAKDPVAFVRQESFLAACKEVVNWAEEIDVTRIGIVGDMHSGKTTMAESIAHAIHSNSKLGWAVKIFYEDDLMNFEETLKTLTGNTNWILRFDDVSFLDAKHNKKAISKVKEAVTKIRHLEGGEDVKVILIYNYHYSKGLDKYLRQADFRFFTTVGSEEEDNFEGIMGTKQMGLVKFFAKNRQNGVTKKLFMSPARMKNGKKFFYKWRNPFIPVLFWNNNNLRMIISPTREWMQPICSICSTAKGQESQVNVKQFLEEYESVYPQLYKNAIKQALKEAGMNTYSKASIQARRFLDKALETKQFNIFDLAVELGLTVKHTRVHRDPKNILPSMKEDENV